MNSLKKATIIAAVTLMATACSAPYKLQGPPIGCPDANPGFITIVINYEGKRIRVPQDPQIAQEGDVLQFVLRGADGVQVSTSGKDDAAQWLNGSGKKRAKFPDTDRFLVCVPRDLLGDQPRKEYKYNVDALGAGRKWDRLDPIVVIEKN